MIAKLTGNLNEIKISIPGNQMFLMFNTSNENNKTGFHALIIESKNFNHNKISEFPILLITSKLLLIASHR